MLDSARIHSIFMYIFVTGNRAGQSAYSFDFCREKVTYK